MRHLVVTPGIGRQHDGEALVGLRGSAQRDPCPRARDDGGDAVVIAAMNRAGVAELGIGGLDLLERGDTGKQAAVELRQHGMDGEVGRRQPAIGLRPHFATGAR